MQSTTCQTTFEAIRRRQSTACVANAMLPRSTRGIVTISLELVVSRAPLQSLVGLPVLCHRQSGGPDGGTYGRTEFWSSPSDVQACDGGSSTPPLAGNVVGFMSRQMYRYQ